MTFWANFKLDNPHLPNLLSIIRGILGLFLPLLILHSSAFAHAIAIFIFIFAALTDYWDGLLARKHSGISDMGKILDPSMDKILILGPMAAFAIMGYYSPWWVVPVFLREFAVTFCRIGLMLEGRAVAAEKMGKLKFVFQVTTLSFAFLYQIAGDFSWLAFIRPFAALFLFLCLIVSVILTLISGYSFFANNKQHFGSEQFAKFVSACGVGLIPVTPGTLGSALGLALILCVSWNWLLYLCVFLAWFWAGHWAVNRLDLSKEKDPHYVVVDEVLGMFITMWGIPLSFASVIVGFVLFRLFDIFKPYPCRRLERLSGFWGITCDDLMAGLYSWIILVLIF